MKKILTFVPNYFPGYLSGGIARTIFNTTTWLGDEFEFLVVTRDRDLGSDVPYPDVRYGSWVSLGNAKVRYLAPAELSLTRLEAFVNSVEYDVLHLNSFFDSVFTIKLLLLNRLNRIHRRTIVFSPRGEFVPGPLAIKYKKKRIYIELSKLLRFYRNIVWHASSPHEAGGIAAALRVPLADIRIAIDLPIRDHSALPSDGMEGEHLRVVFLSRITREKNLDGALRILQRVKSEIGFDIIGPKGDLDYWKECESALRRLPSNVHAKYVGSVPPEIVPRTLGQYDLFFFPTHGENYGHVVAEAISAGTRVLISQSTPWRDLESDGLGWDIELSDTGRFAEVIDSLAAQPAHLRTAARASVRKSALARLLDPAALEQNRRLFLHA